MEKVCTRCGRSLPLEAYYNNRTNSDGKQGFCKTCSDEATYAWRAKNRDKWLAKNAENARIKLYREGYGITPDEYQQMFEAQGGKCAICGEVETSTSRTGRLKTLAVDHCHTSGTVRKLLCHKCNTGLGSFRDRPDLLSAAIEYLQAHEAA